MFWTIVLIILGIVIFGLFNSRIKDNKDLSEGNIKEKFNVFFYALNESAFSGNGLVTLSNKSTAVIYEKGSNQMITMGYYAGSLNVEWKFKYYQKEIIHNKTFYEVRNLSVFEQEKMANKLISEMELKIHQLKQLVNKDIVPEDAIIYEFQFMHIEVDRKQPLIHFINSNEERYSISLSAVPDLKLFESESTINELIKSIPKKSSFIAFPELPAGLYVRNGGDVLIKGWGDALFISNQIEKLVEQENSKK